MDAMVAEIYVPRVRLHMSENHQRHLINFKIFFQLFTLYSCIICDTIIAEKRMLTLHPFLSFWFL
jgi:hypothetical protein